MTIRTTDTLQCGQARCVSIRIRGSLRLVCSSLLLAISLAGCRGDASDEVTEGGRIDKPPISEANPDLPRPSVVFPGQLRSSDATVNRFIEHMLEVCASGDYDAFRNSFGTQDIPTPEGSFEKVWRRVEEVRVAGLYQPQEVDPPVHYVYVIVSLRESEAKLANPEEDLTKRLTIRVFKEAGEWRMGQAPGEIAEMFIVAESRPALIEEVGENSSATDPLEAGFLSKPDAPSDELAKESP